MTVKELIKELQEFAEKYGEDRPIYVQGAILEIMEESFANKEFPYCKAHPSYLETYDDDTQHISCTTDYEYEEHENKPGVFFANEEKPVFSINADFTDGNYVYLCLPLDEYEDDNTFLSEEFRKIDQKEFLKIDRNVCFH